MRTEDLYEFTRRQPFAPFRIHVSDGRVYDIRHPDQAIPMLSRVIIGVPGRNGIAEHSEHIALSHIVRLEAIDTPTPADAE